MTRNDPTITMYHTKPSVQCTEVRFAIFQSGEFITAIIVYPTERKLTKLTSVQCSLCGIVGEGKSLHV